MSCTSPAPCALSSVYGFLQGAWPFGIVEAVWAGVAVRRWRTRTGAAVSTDMGTALVIACDMSAFTPDERRHYHALRAKIMMDVTEAAVTDVGIRARLPGTCPPTEIAEWLALEHRCCPFLDLRLSLKHDGSAWIHIDGPALAQAFLVDEFGDLLGTSSSSASRPRTSELGGTK